MPLRPFLPHQELAFRYAETRDRIALYMEMRLGKSLVAIRWSLARGYLANLIVAPRATLTSWKEELEMEGQHALIIQGANRAVVAKLLCHLAKKDQTPIWVLVNPESVIPRQKHGKRPAIKSPIVSLPWDCVIVDESARIRNPRAMITKVMARCTEAPGRAVLCGLPNPEGPIDFFSQFQFLDGNFMMVDNFYKWKDRYYKQDPINPWQFNPKYGTLDAVKEWVHDRAFVLTRKEAKVGSRKVFEKRTVPLNAAQKKLIKLAKEEYETGTLTTAHILVVLTWLARIAGGFHPETLACVNPAKGRELLSLLTGELKGEQTLVWFRFNAELFAISKLLEKAGIPHYCVTGDTPKPDREAYRHDFQKGKIDVMLIQVKCGKVGLDLSASSTSIYYSNTFSNDDRAQSEDRLIHPKQKWKEDTCLLLDLVSEGSIDEDVVEALRAKRQLSNLILIKLWEKRWGL